MLGLGLVLWSLTTEHWLRETVCGMVLTFRVVYAHDILP